MSGDSIAYHLRQNKAIERNLFIELLHRVGRVRNISDYEYIGFGGPLLEDFKALHSALRIKKMHSIERELNTYKRQQFNRPATFIQLHCKDSDEFFRQHKFSDKGSVVWLDYTTAKDLNAQLQEFHSVVEKLDCYDVAKITLNADVVGLGDFSSVKSTEKAGERLKVLAERIPEYLPIDIEPDDLRTIRYPHTLQRCVQKSMYDLTVRTHSRYFHILSSFVYKDGQQMLTITGMVFNGDDNPRVTEFIEKSRMNHWQFSNLNWTKPTQISVPALSAKERMKLDEYLPLDEKLEGLPCNFLEEQLGFIPGSDRNELANYARYYRAYPHFSRIIL